MNASVVLTSAHVVDRVLRGGAYSNVLIRSVCRDSPDGPEIQGLVYTVLRYTGAIDTRIEASANRSVSSIDPRILDILRVVGASAGAGRAHPGLVVDSGVRAAKRISPKAAGFVNAVSRRLCEIGIFSNSGDVVDDLGVPAWLYSDLAGSWGEEEASKFFVASARSPQVGVRVRPGGTPPLEGVPVGGIQGAFLFAGGELGEGLVVQDPASVAVGNACGDLAGLEVLDVAAAPGTKTLQLMDGGAERIVAMDVHRRRVGDGAKRIPQATWIIGDGSCPPFRDRTFDVVLVDAPCSGLGTLRRRPEIRYRVTPSEIERLSNLQRQMIEASLGLVRPGGRLVYSVCTVTNEETRDAVSGLGAHPPEGLPGRPSGDGWLLAPHLGPTDGMFLAVLDL